MAAFPVPRYLAETAGGIAEDTFELGVALAVFCSEACHQRFVAAAEQYAV